MNLINLFNTCFYVCLVLTILFFVVSVVLFFLFDIRSIFNIKTGRAMQKTIKEMQSVNSSTGRLRVGGKTLTSELSSDRKKKKKNRKKASADYISSSDKDKAKTDTVHHDEYKTEVTDNNWRGSDMFDGAQKTTVLQGEPDPTSVLYPKGFSSYDYGTQPTSQLSDNDFENNQNTPYGNVRNIHFGVVKKLILINTDEIIN